MTFYRSAHVGNKYLLFLSLFLFSVNAQALKCATAKASIAFHRAHKFEIEDPVELYVKFATTPRDKLNILEIPEFAESYYRFMKHIESTSTFLTREEVAAGVQGNITSSERLDAYYMSRDYYALKDKEEEGFLSYKDFIGGVFDLMAHKSPGQYASYRTTQREISEFSKALVIPFVRDKVMSQMEILKYWVMQCRPMQVVFSEKYGDGKPMNPGMFMEHDAAHARGGSILVTNPKKLRVIMEKRWRDWTKFESAVESLPARQRKRVISILFELLHESNYDLYDLKIAEPSDGVIQAFAYDLKVTTKTIDEDIKWIRSIAPRR